VKQSPAFHKSLPLYRRLLTYAWPYKWAFVLSAIGMVLFSLAGAGFAALMKPLVDEGFVNKDPTTIQLMPLLLIAIFVVRGIANFLATYAINWAGRRVIFDIRNAMFIHLMRLPNEFYDTRASSGLISKLIYDVEQIAGGVTEAVFVIVRDGVTVLALFAWMTYLNWRLTLLFVVITPATGFLIRAMSKGFRKTSQRIQESVGEITQVTQEATEGQRVVKAFGGQQAEIEAFQHANEGNRRQAMRKVAVSAVGLSMIQFLAAAALAAVIYIALISGEITAGGFVSYIAAVAWMMGPSKSLTRVNEVVQTALAAAGSVFHLLDEAPEIDSGTVKQEKLKGHVEYRGVNFRYPLAEDDVLQDVSFMIEPGRTLALVGASGSGKTTIANLLPRFYRVRRGEVLLDGININDIELANLRGHIALVGQETLLFNDSIRHNIAYGHLGPIDEERLHAAAEAAYVSEFVDKLSSGLDTLVGERGTRLSGGQRQRIAIARALYKNAPILILDEATSALDTESERYVQAAIQRLMENRTTLVIAHRLSTVEHAHRIVVLSDGKVVESGTHKDLLVNNGAYTKLYRSQFSGHHN
jgi:ATP-binding cassette, subfamily B, bacterial MsbA